MGGGGGGGGAVSGSILGGTRHFFLLILYNCKNIGGRVPPLSPCSAVHGFKLFLQFSYMFTQKCP